MSKKEPTQPENDLVTEKLAEAHNKYLRALADYQNLEKRMGTSIDQARQQARRDVLGHFIGVLDDLEKAEVFVQDAGLKMIMERFKSILDEAGVEELEIVGTEYDPYIAEAVEVVAPAEGQAENIVTEVVRKGYKIGESILRPAQVVVTSRSN